MEKSFSKNELHLTLHISGKTLTDVAWIRLYLKRRKTIRSKAAAESEAILKGYFSHQKSTEVW